MHDLLPESLQARLVAGNAQSPRKSSGGDMSDSVNPQIVDSVATSATSVIAAGPNVALGMFYQAAGQAFSLTMQNASSNQQNLNALNPSIVANALKVLSGA
ncbi:MAG: RebB family R body protein [Azospirillaceae bacterium]|nr:RebB family R body protein [Azospirillaceae bacterium]